VILIVVAVALVLLIALVAGLVLGRKRRVSLREPDSGERPEGDGGKPARTNYQAGGGISLAPGGTTTAEPPAEPKAPQPEKAQPEKAQPEKAEPEAAGPKPAEPKPAEPKPAEPKPAESSAAQAPAADATAPDDTKTPPAGTKLPPAEPGSETPTDAFPAQRAPGETEPPTTPVPVQEPAAAPPPTAEPAPPPAAPAEDIAPPSGRLERLRGRLSRSRGTLGQGLLGLLGAGDLDEESWEELEDTLLMADLGSATTTEIVEQLRSQISSSGVRSTEDARGVLRSVLTGALMPEADRSVHALPYPGGPAVVLIAGVNGTGKTTTTGKLGRVLVAEGRTVLLGAADTFRAAAVEQLATWAERVGAEVVRGKEGADPASVAFDAVTRGAESGVDAVLIDTAGRLHTKTGLMDELGKVKRVVEKRAQVDEVLLVLDATTGQNGLAQARVFSEVVDVTGIVLTKLDGTAKGGIVFQVQRELGVPVKLVGLGEGPDDLAPFEPGAFVDALLG
jgi:fused signal recognition particle receptor